MYAISFDSLFLKAMCKIELKIPEIVNIDGENKYLRP